MKKYDMSKITCYAQFDLTQYKKNSFDEEWNKLLASRLDALDPGSEENNFGCARLRFLSRSGKETREITFVFYRLSYYICGYAVEIKEGTATKKHGYVFVKEVKKETKQVRKRPDTTVITNIEFYQDLLEYKKIDDRTTTHYNRHNVQEYLERAYANTRTVPTAEENLPKKDADAFEFIAFLISEAARLETCRIAMQYLICQYKLGTGEVPGFPFPAYFNATAFASGGISRKNQSEVFLTWDHIVTSRSNFAVRHREMVTVDDIQTFLKGQPKYEERKEVYQGLGLFKSDE